MRPPVRRFPAIQVNHIDSTSDSLVTRAVAEARGGRIIRDVSGGIPGYLARMSEQKLLAPLKGALHPNTALLWARWAISGERQKIYAQAGETPAHPKVEPTEKTRPRQST